MSDCKAPDPLPHGTHRKLNGTTYLSVAVYTCLSGYTFYGNNASQCLANASWSFLDANCTIKDCGEGASSANANISYPNGTVFESTAHVSCMDGYRINGSHGNDNGTETITCTENGTWSQAHGCDRKDCSNETHAVNADVDFVTGTLFESVANVSCILGYKINGTEGNDNITTTIQCMSTGNWSGAPVCVIKDCGYITTSYANITFGDTHYNENATVSCDKGYKVNLTSGNNVTEETITCLSDGYWSNPSGCVKKDCGKNISVDNANISFLQTTLYTSNASVTCLQGHRLKGYSNNTATSEVIQCRDSGVWSSPRGCERKDCGRNITTQNANVTFRDTHYNEDATVSCDKGYKVNLTSGNNVMEETITCNVDGYWTTPSGCVKKDCGMNISVENAENITFQNSTLFQYNATIICKQGYRLKGKNNNNSTTEVIRCVDTGLWTSPSGCEERDCRDPPTSNHSSRQYNSTTYGSKAIFKCDSGYHTGNNKTLTCNSSGHWNTTVPNCTDIDECTEKNTCHRNANCTNNIGSYMCLCKNGYDDMATSNSYDSIGRDCQDHNECLDPKGTHCMYSRNQTQWCTNLDPGYYCRCNPGWKGTNCETNVDECTEVTQPCGHNATCKDGYGTYYCKCDRNFPQGDPFVGCFKPVMLDFEKTHEVCAHGDNEILDPINIPYGRFPYLGKYFDVFRPNLNGFLALNYPPLYERYGAENSTLWEKYVDNHIVIAPLWTNIDTRNITGAGLCVHVLSNKTADAKDMKKIEDLVQQYTNRSDFSVNVAIALTWRNATIHSPYMPGYELFKQQNLSMQAIVVTDSLYTFLLFNYDQEQFSIQPDSYTPVAAGYTYPGNFSGKILANRSNFTNLKNGSNVSPAVKGRWLHNVTYITDDMWDEVRCRKFHENQDLKRWTREQLKNSYPCPCYEQDMKEDYTFKQNDSLWTNRDQYTHCYESWFFNPYDIKQRCCYRFGELRKEYPFAIGAEYNNLNNLILEAGFRQCCSAVNSQRYCHLYYDVNPPDDCSSWSPDDEGVVKRAVRKVMEFVGLSKA
ncbi:sushi, von Willebrand factor type A, EGF and pentraxin domain-containing protein 1-like [Mya arenaria]|uniref:sushi, von Willebrand factor type A, EGF and pentraxin domain-containing protein 1-like n=1 Tax=Mya arenaria TaxID=6604 RepID=UPI0022E3B9E8|nr:sushi, von Willebrand factor type A, EGF and pentraxin domain-containing protein 1-like [Mya arenaria]